MARSVQHSRERYFSETLDLLHAAVGGSPTVVVGPTIKELKRCAPLLWSGWDSSLDRTIPVQGRASLRQIIDAHYRAWCFACDKRDGFASTTILAIPPTTEWTWDELPATDKWQALRPADPNLALAAGLGPICNWVAAVLPASALSDTANHAVRQAMWHLSSGVSNSALRRAAKRASQALELDPDRNTWVQPSREDELRSYWSAGGLTSTLRPHIILPIVSHSSAPEPEKAIAMFSTDDCRPYLYVRTVSAQEIACVSETQKFFEQLQTIWSGRGLRGEPDRFIPYHEIYLRGTWSLPLGERLQLTSIWSEQTGHPLRSLGRIATFLRAGEIPHKATESYVAVQASGRDAGVASLLKANSKIKPLNQEPEVGFIFLTSEDNEYLARTLNDFVVQAEIRCNSYGSWESPIVSQGALEQLEICWPPPETRRKECERIKVLGARVDSVVDLISEVSLHCESLNEYTNDTTASFRTIEWTLKDFQDDFDKLVSALSEQGLYGAKQMPKNSADQSPLAHNSVIAAIIGIPQRRLANEREVHRRLVQILGLAELWIRLDATVLLSIVNHSSAGRVDRLLSSATGRRLGGAISLGHWRSIQRAARKELTTLRTTLPLGALRDYVHAATNVSEQTLGKSADKLVSLRNEYKGHELGLSKPACQRVSEQCSQLLGMLTEQLIYLTNRLMFVPESIANERDRSLIRRTMLVHDNPEFQTQDIRRPRGTIYERLNVGEVYFEVGTDDSLISLWPWMQ